MTTDEQPEYAAAVSTAELPTTAPDIGELIPSAPPLLAGEPTSLPTLRADGGVLGGRWIAAASIAGRSHQAAGRSGQDSYCYTLADDGSALVFAVCDGLGSRPHSAHVGADMLARFACHQVAAITRATVHTAGTRALEIAVAEANAQLLGYRASVHPRWEPSALATTLLVCRMPLDPLGGPTLLARVGDGEMFVLDERGFDTVFPQPEQAWINEVGAALPAEAPAALIETTAVDTREARAITLTTDGLANDLIDSPNVRAWLAHRWSVPCGAHLMLDTLRYRRQGSLDDRTCVVVWPQPAPAASPMPTSAPPRPTPLRRHLPPPVTKPTSTVWEVLRGRRRGNHR